MHRRDGGAAADHERRLQRLQEILDELMTLTDPFGKSPEHPKPAKIPAASHNTMFSVFAWRCALFVAHFNANLGDYPTYGSRRLTNRHIHSRSVGEIIAAVGVYNEIEHLTNTDRNTCKAKRLGWASVGNSSRCQRLIAFACRPDIHGPDDSVASGWIEIAEKSSNINKAGDGAFP